MTSGHLACQGCGGANAMRFALKALGEKTVMVMPACCWSVINGPFPHSAITAPIFHTAFETAASTASGIRAGLDMRGDTETHVLAWAGDGGTFDIGLQALSGAAERNENIIYCCYDNEAYMNTGIQRSSATPTGAWTMTTPQGHVKERPKKRILDIMVAHGIPYVATATIADPTDLMEKFRKAKEMEGMRFLHVFAPCPTGWKAPPDMTIELARRAAASRIFPLVEVYDGRRWEVNKDIPKRPVKDYLEPQGRFKELTDEDIAHVQQQVDANWEILLEKEAGSPAPS